MATVLTKGTVVTAAASCLADVRIENGRIAAVGLDVCRDGDTVVDCSGCYLFPGGIDPHTHFDLPVGQTTTADDFASGTLAAAAGGTTTIIDFATQNKGESLAAALANWHAKAQGKSYVDYGFHLAVSDVNQAVLDEIPVMVKQAGVTSFKLYLAYKNVLQVDDGTLYQVLKAAKASGALVCLHCENGDVIAELVAEAKAQGHTAPRYHAVTRPAVLEQEATSRAVCLAGLAGAPLYVVHVSCAGALDVIRQAQINGQPVYAETCPQYLLLDESCYDSADFAAAKYVISPPLRSLDHQAALWEGLKSGSLSVVASDHCSFNLAGQKELGRKDFSQIPNGAPGVENRFGLLYTYGVAAGKISLTQFVALTSTNAAKLFGLYPQKGTIAVGSDADIVVWDSTVTSVITAAAHKQRVDYNTYEGFQQTGAVRHVFLRGQPIIVNGVPATTKPAGQYVKRQPFS